MVYDYNSKGKTLKKDRNKQQPMDYRFQLV